MDLFRLSADALDDTVRCGFLIKGKRISTNQGNRRVSIVIPRPITRHSNNEILRVETLRKATGMHYTEERIF